jgi:hypothetical protein
MEIACVRACVFQGERGNGDKTGMRSSMGCGNNSYIHVARCLLAQKWDGEIKVWVVLVLRSMHCLFPGFPFAPPPLSLCVCARERFLWVPFLFQSISTFFSVLFNHDGIELIKHICALWRFKQFCVAKFLL